MEEQAFENDFCIIKPCYRYEMCYAQVIIDGQRRALYILGQEHEALRAENGRLITDLKLTAERAGKLRAENERLKQVDADNEELRASTSGAYLQGLEQEIARLQVEAAAMRDAIRDAAIAVEELDYPTQDIFRAVGKLEKLAEQGTTGAAMLRVAEAARGWKETGDGNPLEDALAELDTVTDVNLQHPEVGI